MDATNEKITSLLFQKPDRIPISCGILPAAWIKYRGELDAIARSYPDVFGSQEEGRDYDQVNGTYVEGRHVDVWGCEWENVHHGMESIVTGHPVPKREMINDLKIPDEDAGCPHGFMYLRLQDLRGFEELMIDFAEEPPELQLLLDKVLAYNLRQVRLQLSELPAQKSIRYFGDDLGMQHSLPMSPDTWRKYLKPCYREIYADIKAAGHYIYMHTDGHINEIIMDLKECGVDVINPQVRANGLDNLQAICKGRICVDLDLDRQLFPFCTPEDIDAHVHEAVEKLGAPEGGLWLKAEVDQGVPLENVDAICNSLVKYSTYFS
jgi:uroporphyrinogen decarboxylase